MPSTAKKQASRRAGFNEQNFELNAGTLNKDELLAGLEAMREGLTDAEFAEIERTMNEEYIEPLDDTP